MLHFDGEIICSSGFNTNIDNPVDIQTWRDPNDWGTPPKFEWANGNGGTGAQAPVPSTDIIVSGCDFTSINGTYKLVDSSKTGKERQWRKDTNPAKPTFIYWEDNRWYINEDGMYVTYSYDDVDNPVRVITWENPDGFWTTPPTLSWLV